MTVFPRFLEHGSLSLIMAWSWRAFHGCTSHEIFAKIMNFLGRLTFQELGTAVNDPGSPVMIMLWSRQNHCKPAMASITGIPVAQWVPPSKPWSMLSVARDADISLPGYLILDSRIPIMESKMKITYWKTVILGCHLANNRSSISCCSLVSIIPWLQYLHAKAKLHSSNNHHDIWKTWYKISNWWRQEESVSGKWLRETISCKNWRFLSVKKKIIIKFRWKQCLQTIIWSRGSFDRAV